MCEIRKKLADALKGTIFYDKTYIVGGFVRDKLRDQPNKDIDLVVELQDGGIKLAEFLYQKGLTNKPVIFKRFSTATAIMQDLQLEFVMTRKESYRNDSRKPAVGMGTLQEDVFRRDFTINALLLKIASGEIFDLTGKGRADIENKIIRTTSNPDLLFQEDPLRMLRAVRFAVSLNFTIEDQTFRAIKKQTAELDKISWERKRDEFSRILLSDDPIKGIRLLLKCGLLKELIPELIPLIGQKQNKYHVDDVFDHTLEVMDHTSAYLELRLAALLHDIAKPHCLSFDKNGVHFYGHEKSGADISKQILQRFKYSGKISNLVCKLILNHMKLKTAGKEGEKISDKNLKKIILDWQSELDTYLELVNADNICHAQEYAMPKQIPELKKRINLLKKGLTKAEFPVRGKDILDSFKLKPGKQVGELLNKSKEIWLDNPAWGKHKILKYLKYEEGKMEINESKVTKKVREGVIKAYDLGEDLVQAVGRITREIISTSKEEDLSSKEKVQKLVNEALEGAKQGIKTAQPSTEDFMKKASRSIGDAVKVAAPKVAHFAQEALKGIYEGAKDVYESKKGEKKED